MAKVRVVVRKLVTALPLVLVLMSACSALTGVGKYDVNDCPKGDCSDGGLGSSSGSSGDGSAADGTSTADGAADVTVDTFTCPSGTSLVTLTVSGQPGSIVSEPAGLTVPPNPSSACLAIGQVRLRGTNKGNWTCTAGCTPGNAQDTDTFNFQNPAGGSTITASLQN